MCKFNSNHREDTKQETAYSLFYFLSLLTKGYFSENINNVYEILHFTKKGIKIIFFKKYLKFNFLLKRCPTSNLTAVSLSHCSTHLLGNNKKEYSRIYGC